MFGSLVIFLPSENRCSFSILSDQSKKTKQKTLDTLYEQQLIEKKKKKKTTRNPKPKTTYEQQQVEGKPNQALNELQLANGRRKQQNLLVFLI